MSDADLLRNHIRIQLFSLQDLIGYLEARERFGAADYTYCQAQLCGVLKHLKRLQRLTGAGSNEGRSRS